MKKQGLQPDLVAYNSLFFALRVSNEASLAYELWKEMCGQSASSGDKNIQATARQGKPISPDIITVTDVIAVLTKADGDTYKSEIDEVFRLAFNSKLVLRNDNLDSHFEVDLSTMSFPVARAACRFIFQRIKDDVEIGCKAEDVSLITGVGVSHLVRSVGDKADPKEIRKQSENKGPTLREYVQECLLRDFNPPIESTIPQRAQGTVCISRHSVETWLASTSQQ